MLLIFHIDQFIRPFGPLRCQSGPSTQYSLRVFFDEGDIFPFQIALRHNYSIKVRNNASFCSEMNGKGAAEVFTSLYVSSFWELKYENYIFRKVDL